MRMEQLDEVPVRARGAEQCRCPRAALHLMLLGLARMPAPGETGPPVPGTLAAGEADVYRMPRCANRRFGSRRTIIISTTRRRVEL